MAKIAPISRQSMTPRVVLANAAAACDEEDWSGVIIVPIKETVPLCSYLFVSAMENFEMVAHLAWTQAAIASQCFEDSE